MAKEILLYGQIDAESSSEFIKEFSLLPAENEPVIVRVNCPGGSPEYGSGTVARFKEYAGEKKVKVDGKAYSYGLFFCCYAEKENVEALDVSEFLLHRAAYPDWVERDAEYFTDAMRSNLDRINKGLKTAFENRVDVALFEQLTNCKLKDVFSMESRIDVTFSAAVAKKIGLIGKIITITPDKKAEINSLLFKTASKTYDIAAFAANVEAQQNQSINQNKIKMNLEELKAQNPDVFAAAVALGVKAEKDRVESILVFNHLDPEACKKAIESGESLSAKQMAEFSLKAMSPEALAKLKVEAPAAVTTTEAPVVAEVTADAKLTTFLNEVDKALKRK